MRRLLRRNPDEIASLDYPIPSPLLGELQSGEFRDFEGVVALEGSYEPTGKVQDDPTGLECILNKWHIEDYLGPDAPIEDLVRVEYHTPKYCARRLQKLR